ncbi:MAG: SIMPL domain-containing protein [Thermoleophilia bacterium]|nr:SIMPL domain-containing protein [Thermoleophilia bacterium]
MEERMGANNRESKRAEKLVAAGCLLLIGAVLLGSFAAGCGNEKEPVSLTAPPAIAAGAPNTITVTGEGKVSAVPDEAVLALTVETDAPDAAQALNRNSQLSKKLAERLRTEGVSDSAIKTSDVTVHPIRTYDPQTGKESLGGYRAQNSVTVTLKDFHIVGRILAAAVEIGATNVSGPEWRISENAPAVNEALKKAVDDAEAKAEVLSRAGGVKLGGVLTITAGMVEQPVRVYEGVKAGTDAGVTEPPVSPGTLDVKATVTITYQLER